MIRIFTFILLFMFFRTGGFAQILLNDTLVRVAPITYDVQGSKVIYGAEMPPLNQVAGAPKAFYTYYWEFGDGTYSLKEKPEHHYKRTGTYETRLWATNNYDNGQPPASRPKTVIISEPGGDQASTNKAAIFTEENDLMILHNREPLPDQELVLITSYKNRNDYVSNGKLYLYYNDKQFKNDNFTLKDTRLHHDERIVTEQGIVSSQSQNATDTYLATNASNFLIEKTRFAQDSTKRKNLPLTLEESEQRFRNRQVITFDNMQPGEERNIFRTLETTPEMIKDTSAIVTLRSIYVPDRDYDNHTIKDTEMEIVTSHDPNKMSSTGRLMNYRLVRFKKIKFKIRFQNNGEGPANTIKLAVDTPEMFDKSTLEIKDMSPKCPICPKDQEVNYSCLDTILQKDKILFQFNRIYLAGSQQKNVTEKDSTKGFVKYTMKFGKDFHKKKTRSRTAIYFDKNEPVITNYSATRFIPGISIGAKAGYIINPDLENSKEYFVGATVSPYKSYRGYYQAELMIASSSFDNLKNFETRGAIQANGAVDVVEFAQSNSYQNISIYAVPASFRYNFNNFFAMGAGAQLKMDITSKNDQETTGTGFTEFEQGLQVRRNERLDVATRETIKENTSNLQMGVFIGMTLGIARIGPSIGARYVHNFNSPNSQIQLYGIWKF